jgi:electron transfer flavoprotein alpha subunit
VIGVVVVRGGRVALGTSDVAASARELWLLGDQVASADAPAKATRRLEIGPFQPAAWVAWLAEQVGERSVVLSASPDGRDLAGRLAERLGRPLYAGCLTIEFDRVVRPLYGGATTEEVEVRPPFVATVQVTARGDHPMVHRGPGEVIDVAAGNDVRVEDVLEPDLESVDLSDARRIVAGGAGLSGPGDFEVLRRAGAALGAAMGATRVVTDRGWVPPRRQIGTTGVTVSPELYVAFGISGAVQHTAGLGTPEHVISVNADPACPMSLMADLAIVSDAPQTVAALAERLGDAP